MKKMRKFIACASFKIHKIGIYQSDKFKFVQFYKLGFVFLLLRQNKTTVDR